MFLIKHYLHHIHDITAKFAYIVYVKYVDIVYVKYAYIVYVKYPYIVYVKYVDVLQEPQTSINENSAWMN